MTQDISSNNKRIAKNTLMLYLRMFLIMGVSLYTSRVILVNLGVEDFGTYNVVGGIVVLFAFINNAMVTATQRFLNFELGKQNYSEMNKVFSMSLNIHILIVLAIVVLGETIGLYVFYHFIKIPEGRLFAAKIVYQLSILTMVFNILRTPYNATIIAYEHMSVYAYLSIFEAIAKLAIASALMYTNGDRLVLYAILLTGVALSIFLFYYGYSRFKFDVCKYKYFWDNNLFKRLTSFSGWNLLGSLAVTGAFQGVSIVQNFFGGVFVNAAMGIANQVNAAIYGFSSNFQMAFNPQITKYYAAEDYERLHKLTFMATKTSFFLVWILALPIIVCCNNILELWLKEVPEHAVIFCRLILVNSLFDAISAPLWMNVQATGKIKVYQIFVSLIIILNLPLSMLVLYVGFPAESVIVVRIFLSALLILYRCLYMKQRNLMQLRSYVVNAILPCLLVTIVSVLISFGTAFLPLHYIIIALLVFVFTVIVVLLLGFSNSERDAVWVMIRKRR